MKGSIFSGVSDGAKRFTTFPSLSTRNFVKFHLIAPFFSLFKYLYKGSSFLPLTLIFENCENVIAGRCHFFNKIFGSNSVKD